MSGFIMIMDAERSDLSLTAGIGSKHWFEPN
jgi:hypothetical protein